MSLGFDDAFRAIERLSMYVFDIPEDTAVKQFKDMRTMKNCLFS